MIVFQKLWALLTINQCRAALVLFGLMLIGMTLEMLGIGLVIPALALMTQGDLSAKYPAIIPWLSYLDNPSHEHLVVAGMLILIVVYAVKALFLAFLAWRQAHFVHGLGADISQRLFTGYLYQPYTFHLQRNSAQLIRNTMGQAGELASTIQQGILLLTEVLVLFGISVLLFIAEPLGALLVMSILSFSGWIFNRLTRSRIVRWGEIRQVHQGLRIQHLQQGFGGAKDVKLLGREGGFLSQYQLHNVGSARVGQRQATLLALPRLWLELLSVTGLAVLVWVMIAQGKPTDVLLPILGLFAAAAFRLIPSVNRIISAIQSLRFSLPVIDNLHNEFKMLEKVPKPSISHPLSFNNTLTLDQISFQYPSAEALALRGISLTINQGSSVGFIGGSGAGKSTLVDIILGLFTPTAGAVEADGIDIQANLRGWQSQIGYVPQSIFLSDDTLRRNIAFGLPNKQIDEAAIWCALRAAQLDQFVNDLPQGLEAIVGERGIRLSGGQRQRIGIARALYHDPSILVLDEATSSLDSATEQDVMEAVRALEGDKTLIIVAHRLSTVEHCDRLFRIEGGKIVEEGKAASVLGTKATKRA